MTLIDSWNLATEPIYRVQTSQSVLDVQCSHSVTPLQEAIARP